MNALNDLDSIRGQASLLAEPKYIDSGTSPDGGKEQIERCGRACDRGLVCWHSEFAEVGIHAGATGEVNENFHECISFHLSCLTAAAAAFVALEFQFDLGFIFEFFKFDRIGIAGLIAASQGSREDVSELIINR